MKLLAPIFLISSIAYAANDDDFRKLDAELQKLYDAKPRMIPLIVRLAYHDLLNQPKASGSGCIQKSSFQRAPGNGGLTEPVNELERIINGKQFENADFRFGDVIAFASKVAVEKAYPCVNIKFKYNRPNCNLDRPVITGSSAVPDPNMSRLSQMTPHHQYFGFNLQDFVTLTIGAHAIKDSQARAGVSGFDGIFSKVSSGAEYIKTTLEKTWIVQRVRGVLTFRANDLIRTPSDMLWYPGSKVQFGRLFKRKGGKSGKKSKNKSKKNNFRPDVSLLVSRPDVSFPFDPRDRENQMVVQQKLQSLTEKDKFDVEFERVYELFLNAGGGSKEYIESVTKAKGCPGQSIIATNTVNSAQPAVTTSVAVIVPSKTLLSIETSAITNVKTNSISDAVSKDEQEQQSSGSGNDEGDNASLNAQSIANLLTSIFFAF